MGAALGTSGAVMQSVFGNPLAEPGVIGVSSGAAGWRVFVDCVEPAVLPVFSRLLHSRLWVPWRLLRWCISCRVPSGRAKVLSMILTGIAVTAVANAIIAFLMFIADTTSRDQIVFWQMGSLNGSTWKAVASVWPVILIGLVACFVMASAGCSGVG